jgi:hypothetical protein
MRAMFEAEDRGCRYSSVALNAHISSGQGDVPALSLVLFGVHQPETAE